jgi:hypothetical protein
MSNPVVAGKKHRSSVAAAMADTLGSLLVVLVIFIGQRLLSLALNLAFDTINQIECDTTLFEIEFSYISQI